MASSSKEGKQYGLIMNPAKQKKQMLLRKTIFDEDDELESSDSDGNNEADNLKLPVRQQEKPLYPGRPNLQVKSVVDKALEEDPNVFAYDEVYDDIKAEKEAKVSKKSSTPKYMGSLLKSAELRKREQERREERKIQKEREEEGDEFADKEAFITPAYKEKLEELKKTEEREKKESAFEAALDVTKQRDLSGFYRHLLNQSVGEEKVSLHSISDRFDKEKEQEQTTTSSTFNQIKKSSKNRQIRQRKDSSSSNSEEEEEEEIRKREKNKEKDKELSRNSKNSSRVSTSVSNKPERHSSLPEPPVTEEGKGKVAEKNNKGPDRSDDLAEKSYSSSKDEMNLQSNTEVKDEPPTVSNVNKVDRRALILERFTKRTVGQVFEDARRRYLERKAAS